MVWGKVLSFLPLVLAMVSAVPTNNTPVLNPVTAIGENSFRDTFGFPFFANLFAPLWNIFPSFLEIGPEVKEDNNTFLIAVKVKGYQKPDLSVRVKNGLIFAQGAKEATPDSHDLFASQFIHTYSLPPNASAEEVKAELTTDQYLIITAPISETANNSRKIDRLVEIKETGEAYKKGETPVSKPNETKPALETFDEDKKESTTQSTKEEVTEKDNSIPHGDDLKKTL